MLLDLCFAGTHNFHEAAVVIWIFHVTLKGRTRRIPKPTFTYVMNEYILTYMEKTLVYPRNEELQALREAIRKVVLKPQNTGPVGIWDGEPRRSSVEHDSVHDEP